MEARRDTKKQILDLAENLIKTKGYFGFSYKDIAGALEVKNAAIHYHFPTKEDLGRAVMDREINRFKKWEEHLDDSLSITERLKEFIGIYEYHLKGECSACLIGATATVFPILPNSLRSKATELANALLTHLEALLAEGRDEGAFHFPGSAKAKASVIAASLAGGLQLARIGGQDFFYTLTSQIIDEITHSNP